MHGRGFQGRLDGGQYDYTVEPRVGKVEGQKYLEDAWEGSKASMDCFTDTLQ